MIVLPSGNKVPISISNLKTQTKIDGTGLLFPSENFIENDTIVIVNTCEQLLYALFCSIKIQLDPTDGGFYFQNDPNLKEGCEGGVYVYATEVKPKLENSTIIIQGLQITGDKFFCGSATQSLFYNIYLKDCVHTKTSNSETFDSGSGRNIYFYDCKCSMHIRTNDYGYSFGDSGIHWIRSSRYIEYSDLTPDSIGQRFIFGTEYANSCSTIIRNASCHVDLSQTNSSPAASTTGTFMLLCNGTNSSYDVEFYRFDVDEDLPNPYSNGQIRDMNNCFISLKCKKDGYNHPASSNCADVLLNTSNNMKGVNVYNTGDTNDANYKSLIANNNCQMVIQLPESSCKNYDILNRWGFFVNRVVSGD